MDENIVTMREFITEFHSWLYQGHNHVHLHHMHHFFIIEDEAGRPMVRFAFVDDDDLFEPAANEERYYPWTPDTGTTK